MCLVAHQRRAHLVFDHLFHRAAEIEVDDVRAAILGHTGGFGQDFGLAAGQLHRQKALVRLPLRHSERLAVFPDHRLAGEHLGHNQFRSEFPDDAAERPIGDPGHRRKDNRALKRHSAEPDGLQSQPPFCEMRRVIEHGPEHSICLRATGFYVTCRDEPARHRGGPDRRMRCSARPRNPSPHWVTTPPAFSTMGISGTMSNGFSLASATMSMWPSASML